MAEQVPEKNVIPNDGFCPVHKAVTPESILALKKQYPDAEFLVHPECIKDVLALADFVGSTSAIIQYAQKSEKKEFLVGTEEGVMYELRKKCPDKIFHSAMQGNQCKDMKMVTLKKVRDSLKNGVHTVEVSEKTREGAKRALDAMLNLAK